MVSRIAKKIPFEHVSIQHLGVMQNGVKTPWVGANGFENYTLVEKDGGIEIMMEMVNTPDDFCPEMNIMWPKALEVLKQIAEK
ncbi:MAG: hypothetical protein K9M36_02605 [Candidatus Pacebacteria bacterium]|nr:hypothetical protein [Candidatus Paceibacterota bacterium]